MFCNLKKTYIFKKLKITSQMEHIYIDNVNNDTLEVNLHSKNIQWQK